MIVVKVLVLAIIGALIGWLTNLIAIKLMFRPLYPVKIPVLNYSIQGLIPKRREELAKSIGDVIENELLSMNEILDKAIEGNNMSQIKDTLKNKINEIIRDKLPAIVPSMFKNMIYSYVDEFIERDGEDIIRDFSKKAIEKASKDISLSQIVEEKINSFDIRRIEEIIVSIAKQELKHIEILGGILGFFIGIVQGIIVILL
ncbi:Protein of unknown function [Proteiniborus ethanoligenes]|uniref:DUF445 family protein n=1 Tax=Proteiniborus ethanoligenes TaxID=415015 RepID=A0A1H3RUV5_9FIRM|nr:DUF445 family protein [Proteiniborus ethanoligenes]TAH63487.1 MAG: DUF445 family protein [Gottschalkiaceae bacterium]SDZ29402.1 Protein of unknown function [Proteiniborus ethanoligenes]